MANAGRAEIGPVHIRLDAHEPHVGELPVIAGLKTAHEAVRIAHIDAGGGNAEGGGDAESLFSQDQPTLPPI